MRIYLDIDGVILANELHPAVFAREFLRYIADEHEVYWLTTHCRGDCVATQQHLARIFQDKDTLQAIAKFKPTNWGTAKTEAIDFNVPFVWLDDDLYDDEKQVLEANQAMNSFWHVDLKSDPSHLISIKERLQGLISSRITSTVGGQL
jgi:hypothetical protein